VSVTVTYVLGTVSSGLPKPPRDGHPDRQWLMETKGFQPENSREARVPNNLAKHVANRLMKKEGKKRVPEAPKSHEGGKSESTSHSSVSAISKPSSQTQKSRAVTHTEHQDFTESQNSRGWKGPLWVI